MAFKRPFQPISCDSMNTNFSALLEDVASSAHQWSCNSAQTPPLSASPLSLTTTAAHLESSCKGFCAMWLSPCGFHHVTPQCISRWFPKFPNPFLPALFFVLSPVPMPLSTSHSISRNFSWLTDVLLHSSSACWICALSHACRK